MAVYESKYEAGDILYVVHSDGNIDNIGIAVRALEIFSISMIDGKFSYALRWANGEQIGQFSEQKILTDMAKNILFDKLEFLNAHLDKLNKNFKKKMKTMKSLIDKRKLKEKLSGDKEKIPQSYREKDSYNNFLKEFAEQMKKSALPVYKGYEFRNIPDSESYTETGDSGITTITGSSSAESIPSWEST